MGTREFLPPGVSRKLLLRSCRRYFEWRGYVGKRLTTQRKIASAEAIRARITALEEERKS